MGGFSEGVNVTVWKIVSVGSGRLDTCASGMELPKSGTRKGMLSAVNSSAFGVDVLQVLPSMTGTPLVGFIL